MYEKRDSMPKKKETKKSGLITKDMALGEIVRKHPEAAEIMGKHGMHCIGCHVSAYETIEQGAVAHGIDAKKLIDDLNRAAKKKKQHAI